MFHRMESGNSENESFTSTVNSLNNLRLSDGACIGNASTVGAPQNMLPSKVPSNHINNGTADNLVERKDASDSKEIRRGAGTIACQQYTPSSESPRPSLAVHPPYHWQVSIILIIESEAFSVCCDVWVCLAAMCDADIAVDTESLALYIKSLYILSTPKPMSEAIILNPYLEMKYYEMRLSLPRDEMKIDSYFCGKSLHLQATKTTVKERFSFLFNNETLSDVHFVVGRDSQQQTIPAHRFVLTVGSGVFDAMFNGTLATQAETIDLPDVEPAAFLALLRFLYSDEVCIEPETVMTTLYTAKKYVVPALEKHCVEFLKGNLCSENAFLLLTQARLFDEPQLAALCLESIDQSTAEAFSADGFVDVDLDTLAAVLERDTLRIREAKVFQAVVRWSEAECVRQQLPPTPENRRTVLGHVLRLVRFPLMTVEEFAIGAAQSGLLTDREVVSLFLYFTVNPKPHVPFVDAPRCCMTGKEQTVCRFLQIESRWGYSGTSDRIRFLVDRRIFVVGFGLYGSIHGPAEFDVNIQVIHTASGKVYGSNNTSFSCDGSNYTFRVMFKEPVEITPNSVYTASATLRGPDSHYGTKGSRKVTLDCPSGGKVTFQFSYAAGNNNGTSVEDGQIPEIIFYI